MKLHRDRYILKGMVLYLFTVMCICTFRHVGADDAAAPAQQPAIMIDWIHANDFSMIGLKPDVYEYHLQSGFRRGFEYLNQRGLGTHYESIGPITPGMLSKYRLLFLNLVSAEREPFTVDEIKAIKDYIENGGSMLVITDHTNCYYHSHRLKPLFNELGLKSYTSTACDVPPNTLGTGNGWIMISRFAQHPVTRGLRGIGFQSGGCADQDTAVAFTSPESWADEWQTGSYGEENAPGFYGNFERDPGEKNGPLGVVAAKELGRGRIVVVGDQNIFSDTFINYADNYRLWLNIMAWLLHDESLTDAGRYETSQSSPRIVFYEQYDRPMFGSDADQGYFNAMCLINRHYWTLAIDRLPEYADLLVLADDRYVLPKPMLDQIVRHLLSGKNILILHGETETPAATADQSPPQQVPTHRQIAEAMAAHTTKTTVSSRQGKNITQYHTQTGPVGAVHILTGNTLYDNTTIPKPTVKPPIDVQHLTGRLMMMIHEALQ